MNARLILATALVLVTSQFASAKNPAKELRCTVGIPGSFSELNVPITYQEAVVGPITLQVASVAGSQSVLGGNLKVMFEGDLNGPGRGDVTITFTAEDGSTSESHGGGYDSTDLSLRDKAKGLRLDVDCMVRY